MTIAMPSPEEEIELLVEYVHELQAANNRLSQMLAANADRLDESKRELLAIGWCEGFTTGKSRAMRHMSDEPELSLDVPNPYRESLDLSGGGL